MPRLGHKKSRLGCRQCKTRHVKCDEGRPCSNCTRHGVLCSLMDPDATPPLPHSSSSNSSTPKPTASGLAERPKPESHNDRTTAQSIKYVLNASPVATNATDGSSPSSSSDAFPFITNFVHRKENVQHANLWLRDLELMHHWMASAVDTTARREDVRYMFRTVAPKDGIKYTFLMHEVLAFSALHLAYLHPEKKADYHTLGIHHQDHALRGMRKVLQNVTDETASPAFATSLLITLTSFASRGQDAQDPERNFRNAIDDMIDIFLMIQGIGGILAASQLLVLNGPYGPVFRDPLYEIQPDPAFPEIRERLPALSAILEDHSGLDEDMRRELVALVALFRDAILRANKPLSENRELRFLFYVPIFYSANILNWVRDRHPGVLVVFAYYAVALLQSEPYYWFLKGWGHRSIVAISDAVVDPGWRGALEWPLQVAEHRQNNPVDDVGIAPPSVKRGQTGVQGIAQDLALA